MDPNQCLACDVNFGRIDPPGGPIYVDELWQADHELTPLLRGYLILKPRRHVHYFSDLTAPEAASFGPVLQHILTAVQQTLAPERVYVCSFAETVHHLHFHLIPRYADMPALGPDLLPAVFQGQWRCEPDGAAQAAAKMRAAMVASFRRE